MHLADLQRDVDSASVARKKWHLVAAARPDAVHVNASIGSKGALRVTAYSSGAGESGSDRGRRQRAARRLLAYLFGAAIGFILASRPAVAGEDQPLLSGPAATVPQPSAANSSAVLEGASGIIIHIDPRTGVILKKPAAGTVPLRLTPQLLNAISTSHEGLVVVPSPVPGGGFKIDLQGRFQSSLIGTIDANGQLRMRHLDAPQSTGKEVASQPHKEKEADNGTP